MILDFKLITLLLKKIQRFEESRENPNSARLFIILIRRREIELISDGNKLIEVKVTYKDNMKILNFKDFMKKYNPKK